MLHSLKSGTCYFIGTHESGGPNGRIRDIMIRTTPHLNEGKASELLKTEKQIRNKSPSAQSPSDPQAFLFLSAIYSNTCSMKMCVWYIKQSSGYIVFFRSTN